MRITLAAFLMLLFVAISSAGRTNRLQKECTTKCDDIEDSIFKQGKSYTYMYQGDSDMETVQGSYDNTGLMVKSKVIVTAVTKCQMKLKITNVEIFDKTSSDGNRYKKTPFSDKAKEILERNEVLFTRSGEDVKTICINKNEPIWAQNMKKSIIDILANNGQDKNELETRKTRHGKCLVTKTLSTDMSKTTSYDVKSCKSCSTQSLFTDLTEAVVFNMSQVQCKYAYQKQNDPQTIYCTEDYVTTPIRLNGNSLKVKVTTRLEKSESNGFDVSYSTKDMVKSRISMKNDPGEISDRFYNDAKETIKLMCDQHVASERSEIPATFMTLVNQLKRLSSAQIKQIYTEVLKTGLCPGKKEDIKSMFYDAIGFVNTPAATSVMVDLIKTNQISELDQTVWFTSLSFMKSTPTLEMIQDLETLLQTGKGNKQMFLGIGAVTHLYCLKNSDSCLSDPTVQNILSFYLNKIGKNCASSTNDDDLSKVLISLKSLGNLKLFGNDVVSILSACVSTKSNPTSVRVSALEVMKHMDCSKDRSVAMEILQNNENDSEMRINSYLTVMGCPDINTMFKIRDLLLKERVNQVGSFIWTHLTNIQESDDYLKSDIQKLLNEVELKNEFDISKLKFSRNIEKTFSTDRFGMTFDSNVIFSEKSFVPRSLSVNTTASVLGRSTNFIEMSARMEGIDDLLFKLLGPEGYLKTKGTVNSVDDNVKLIKMLEDISGNFNFKLFGQQISFVELIRGSLSSVRKYNIIEEIMKIGQGKSMEVKKNLVLLDHDASIPTSLGFPLKFKVQGSVAVKLKIKTKLDLAGLMEWPVSINIESEIAPSVMSEYTLEMAMETPFSNYGMKMKMKSGTDTEFNAIISASKNEQFTVKFDTPKTKQEIVTVTGKSFVIFRNNEVEQMTNKMQKFELCLPGQMKRLLGIKLCASAEVTDVETRKSAFLYGPFSGSLYIEKEDMQHGYILNGLFKTVPFISESGVTYHSRFFKLQFDTPGSQLYYRKFAVEMIMDFKEKLMKLELITPWKDALLASSYKFSDELMNIKAAFAVNSKKIVGLEMEHLSYISKKRRTEKGRMALSLAGLMPFETTWMFVGKRDQWMVKFDSKGLLKDKTNFKIEVKEIQSTRELAQANKYKLSGSYEMYFGKGKISGVASENYYGHRWDVTLNHSPRSDPKSNFIIKFRHKTENKSSRSLIKYFLTSTISYGESAENFIKFNIENELSTRHIRASVKTSYGQNGKSSEEIDLQLYGGFTWKEERHYAEGSLSFKFPSKGVNYEGRYNSEVGMRMFKLSLVLDKDQQSKVNLKINYHQPKLYLKDTELEVTFSLPNTNVNLNWNLKEVDVNKYTYALVWKYNNHALKIDGVQTEISRLKYDSSMRIVFPTVKYWPEKLNLDLRVDFVNPSSSGLNGKIVIPNTNHKYSFDLQLSTMPDNFLQLPPSGKVSVFNYKLKISNMVRTIASETIFTCNPEEFQVYFNLAWDSPQNRDQQITFDLFSAHKSPNFKRYDNSARILVQYPGNRHSVAFKSEFKFTELDAKLDITWNKNRKIALSATYQIDNSWTEKGLKALITMTTPFAGLEQTQLGINAVGQLRYRKVGIEFKWAGNKKVLFDIVVHPRSSNDFTLISKLVTPFNGMRLIAIQVKYITTINSITSEASLELGPNRRYNIKFDAINNNEGRNRDIQSNLKIGYGAYDPVKLSFSHKDDTVHFKSQFDVSWRAVESINFKNDFSYTFEDRELITNGIFELQSTVEMIKQIKATWSMENRESTFLNNVQLLYKSKNIFQNSIKGFLEKEDSTVKMEFNGFMRILSNEPLKATNFFSYDRSSGVINNFSIVKDTTPAYSHRLVMKKNELSLKMMILKTEFKTIEFKATMSDERFLLRREMWLKIGERYMFKETTKIMRSKNDMGQHVEELVSDLYSDFLKTKDVQIKTKLISAPWQWKVQFDATSKAYVLLKIDSELKLQPTNVNVNVLLNSSHKRIRSFAFNCELDQGGKDKPMLGYVNINYNEVLKFKSKVSIAKPVLFDVDVVYSYRKFSRFLRVKYNRHLMGYDCLLKTNLFGTSLNVIGTIESRGGVALHTTVSSNLPFLRSLEIIGRFSRNDHQLDMFYKFPNHRFKNEVVKLKYLKKGGLYHISVNTQTIVSTTFKINLNNLKKILFEYRTMSTDSASKLDIKFDYEGGLNVGKHYNVVKMIIGDVNVHLENKIENVKWSYLLLGSELKTNVNRLSNYKVGFEYVKRPSKLEIDLKAFCNERFVRFSTKFLTTSNLKSEFKIETSFPILREIIFDLTHKQNSELTQVTHGCKLSLKSNDRKFQMENHLEWSGVNFIVFSSSVVARTSREEYFIQPKSIVFRHQFIKNILTEMFAVQISDNARLKVNLQLPLLWESNCLFELDSSFPVLGKWKMNAKFDVLDSAKMMIKFEAERDEKLLINIDWRFVMKENVVSMMLTVEHTGRHALEMEYERKDTSGKLRLKAESTKLEESVNLLMTYDRGNNEGSAELRGISKNLVSMFVKFTRNNIVVKMKYGVNFMELSFLSDDETVKLNGHLNVGNVIKLDLKRTVRSAEFTFAFDDNVIKITGIRDQEITFDYKILKTTVSAKLKAISMAPYKYELSGQTSFTKWSTFNGEIYIVNGPRNFELTSTFTREDSDIYSIIVRQLTESLNLKYESIFDVMKFGELTLTYPVKTRKITLRFLAVTVHQKKVKLNVDIFETMVKGELSTPFEWMRDVSIKGNLDVEKEVINGKFYVKHNMLKEPIRAKLVIDIESTSWKVLLETPLSAPYNKLSCIKTTENAKVTLELRDHSRRIFIISLDTNTLSDTKFYLNVILPETIADFKLTIGVTINVLVAPYSTDIKLKSNLFQDISGKGSINPNDNSYALKISHPSKNVGVTFKITGTKTLFTSEYNGKMTSIEVLHKMEGPFKFTGYLKAESNMYTSSPVKFEISCKHNIELEKELLVNLESKWNDETAFMMLINMQRNSPNSLDFKSKLVLVPYKTKYESSLEFSMKNGKEFNLVFSPMGKSRLRDITVKFTNNLGKMTLLISTPYDVFKSVGANIDTLSAEKRIVLETNKLGKIELTFTDYKETNSERVTISRFKSKYVNLYATMKLKRQPDEEMAEIKLYVDNVLYEGKVSRKGNDIVIKVKSPIQLMKQVEMSMTQNENGYEMSLNWNEYWSSIVLQHGRDMMKVLIKSNTNYAKLLSLTLSRGTEDSSTSVLTMSLVKNSNKMEVVIKSKDNNWQCQFTNSLFSFLPTDLRGRLEYSQRPLKLQLDVTQHSKTLLKLNFGERELLVLVITKLSEFKLRVTRSRFEMIVLNSKVFSILIAQSSSEQVDASVMINETQYSTKLKMENDNERFYFKITAHKNSLDKLLELFVDVKKRELAFDSEFSWRTNLIGKFKFSDKITEQRKLSTEMKLLFVTAVFDVNYLTKKEMFDCKVFWNIKRDDNQLSLGSIAVSRKYFSPIVMSLHLSLLSASYQFQLAELENGSYRIRVATPFKNVNFNLIVLYTYNPSTRKFFYTLSLSNELTGEYDMLLEGKLTRDPEMRFRFGTKRSILKMDIKTKISMPEEFSLSAMVKVLDWEKFELLTKLENKDKVKLMFKLMTPFQLLREISAEKTLWVKSMLEHKFETVMEYKGIVTIKYVGGHEISFIKRVIKINGNIQSEELSLLSLKFHGSRNKHGIDHLAVVEINERRYGYRMKGKFTPLFEGMTEIYTPFHRDGSLVLQGRQRINGFKIQAGRNKEEIAAFEYASNKEVTFVKITPPPEYGKPLAAKIMVSRHKRRAGDRFQSSLKYGDEDMMDLISNIRTEKNQNHFMFKIKSPMFLKKSAELKVFHKYDGDTIHFSHHLKIDDAIDRLYKFFGSYYNKDYKNFKFSVNLHHPYYKPLLLSLGHNIDENIHNSHFAIESDKKILFLHNGKVMFQLKKVNGEFKIEIPNRQYRVAFYHNGDLEKFEQTLSGFYNAEPYISYKVDIVPEQRVAMEIDLPVQNGQKIKLMFDRQEKKAAISVSSNSYSYLLESMVKNREFKGLVHVDNERLFSMVLGYGTTPLFIHLKYLKHFVKIEAMLKESAVIVKAQSSSRLLKTAHLRLTRNKVMAEFSHNDEPLSFSLEYHFVPNNFFVVIETSFKRLSKIAVYVSNSEIKINVNELFQIIRYDLQSDNVIIESDNNFCFVRQFKFTANFNRAEKTVNCKLQINSYIATSEVKFSDDKLTVEFTNNEFYPRSVQMELSRKSGTNLRLWLASVTADKMELVKLVAQINEFKYSLGVETNFSSAIVLSFDKQNNNLIMSIRHGEKYLNVLGKVQRMITPDSKLFVLDASIDSSSIYLEKAAILISFTETKTDFVGSFTRRYNRHFFVIKTKLTKYNFSTSVSLNEAVYIIRITLPNSQELVSELITPDKKVRIEMKNIQNQYSMGIKYNKENVLKIDVNQNRDVSSSIQHRSLIWYRENKIWDFNFNADFKRYEMTMAHPMEMSVVVRNEWAIDRGRIMSIWMKYLSNGRHWERGLGATINLDPNNRFTEINVENTDHIITLTTMGNSNFDNIVSINLLNKISKNQWNATCQLLKNEKFEIHLSGPEGKRAIKYYQMLKDGVKTSVDFEITGLTKVTLKSNGRDKALSGSLILFEKKIANIVSTSNYVKVIINEDGPESSRITFEWSKVKKGVWKKDYMSTTKLLVKQKALKIDVDIEHSVKMEASLYAVETKTKYLMIGGAHESLNLAAVLDFRTPDAVTIEVKNPIIQLKSVLKRHQPDESTLRYDMETVFNTDNKISGFLKIAVGHKLGFTSRLYYNPENQKDFLQIHAKYLDSRQVEARVYTANQWKTVDYFQFLVRLLNEHNLETTLRYQTGGVSELKSKVISIMNSFNGKVNDFVERNALMMMKEYADRYNQLIGIIPGGQMIKQKRDAFVKVIKLGMRLCFKEIDEMIKKDEFFVKTIIETVFVGLGRALNNLVCVYRRLFQWIYSIDLTRFFRYIEIYKYRVCKITGMLVASITNPVRHMMIRTLDNYFPTLTISLGDSVENLVNFIRAISTAMRTRMVELTRIRKMFVLTQMYRQTVSASNTLKEIFRAIARGSFKFLSQENEIKAMYHGVVDKLDFWSKELSEKLNKIPTEIDDTTYMLTGDRYCTRLRNMFSNIAQYVLSLLKDERNQKIVKGFIVASIEESFLKINQKISPFIKNLMMPTYIMIVRNPELNNDVNYVLMVTSPIPINDLQSIPDFSYVNRKIEEIKDVLELVKKLMREKILSGYQFIELIKWFSPQLPLSSLSTYMPDFESYATILGYSVVTFDKKTLQIRADQCSVTLAKDLRFKKWEIVLEQNKDGRSYIVIIGRNKLRIAMSDSKVSVNGKAVELPLSIGSTRIISFGSLMKLKDDILGLTITVDPLNDIFTVGISGWYHGQIRGLFGTADNEPVNDMLNDEGKRLTAQEFFKTYSNGGLACKMTKDIDTRMSANKNCPFLRKVVCKFLYQCPFSPMASCFGKVDPSRFFDNCIGSADRFELTLDMTVCQSAREYQNQCRAVGINIPVPPPCRKCDMKGEKPLSINDVRYLKSKEKVVDIVFVVDEGKCLENIRTKLKKIISMVDENMKEKGITSTRYGLVTFRGDGINEAHTHTINQKLFGSKEEMLLSISLLQATQQSMRDIDGAIMLASRYPFREYASKHLVMINCGSCEESENRFTNTIEVLDNKEIQFSMLMDYNFQVKDGESKKMIFGVDAKQMYTTMAWRGEVANDIHRPFGDYCYKLAMRRSGVVFDINYLITKNEATQKRFIDTFSTQVTLTALPARTTKCTCAQDGEYNCVAIDTYAIFPAKKTT